MTIKTKGFKSTRAVLKRIERDVKKWRPLLTRIGRVLRDDAKLRITTQDGGTYAPLSKWTRARTGRRKAFISERKGIGFRVKGPLLMVGHTPQPSTSGKTKVWSFDKHARGFSTPGFPGSVTIKLKNPKALKPPRPETGGLFTIHSPKEQVTPARQVFANPFQAQRLIRKPAEAWLRNIAKRLGK